MKISVIGGQNGGFQELYHYTDSDSLTMIPPRRFWTEYKTNLSSKAKTMTGSTNHLNFRVSVRVNSKTIYDYFEDVATKWGPKGYPAALEFKNKETIRSAFFKIDRIY